MSFFYLIRHAEKAYPPDLLAGRTPGITLSEKGRTQAAALAEALGDRPLERVYSSPIQRAQETAEAIATAKSLTVEPVDSFIEIDFGAWTNLSIPSLKDDLLWQRFNRFRSNTRIPGGESMRDAQNRFVAELLSLQTRYPDAHIAIVSHGDPIRAVLLYFLGAPLDYWDHLEISIASVSLLELSVYGSCVLYMNRTIGAAGELLA